MRGTPARGVFSIHLLLQVAIPFCPLGQRFWYRSSHGVWWNIHSLARFMSGELLLHADALMRLATKTENLGMQADWTMIM
jgi:hypothetical protein